MLKVAISQPQKYNTCMFSKKLHRFIHQLALFAMVFASLAPSISHALTSQNSFKSFSQEICNSTGGKIVIQVVTTKGQQLSADFALDQPTPKVIDIHVDHCPFCSNSLASGSLPATNRLIIALLTATAQQIAHEATPMVVSRFYVSPPSQAPPSPL